MPTANTTPPLPPSPSPAPSLTELLTPPSPLRLAHLNDLPRLTHVSVASFAHSPHFIFERPHHAAFPQDTYAYYRRFFEHVLRRRDYAVFAVEDVLEKREDVASMATLLRTEGGVVGGGESELKAGGRGIVGWVTVVMNLDVARRARCQELLDRVRTQARVHGVQELVGSEDGHAQADEEEAPPPPTIPGRDHDIRRHERLMAFYVEVSGRYEKDTVFIAYLAVHPAYHRRGHALRLCACVTALARATGVDATVCSNDVAAAMYERAGFAVVEEAGLEMEEEEVPSGTEDVDSDGNREDERSENVLKMLVMRYRV